MNGRKEPKELGVRDSVVVVMLSQFAGVLALVLVPILLANLLDKEVYGLYAQFQLLLQTFLIFAIAGFPEALVYFVARKRADAADFLLGALVQLGTVLVVIAALLWFAGPTIIAWLTDETMVRFLVPLLLSVIFYAVGDTLFTAQTAQKRFRTFSVIYVVFALVQSALVIVVALKTRRLEPVIWAYVVAGGVKALGALIYIGIEVARTGWKARPRTLQAQWAYALPYTGTQALKKINGQLHKYFVTASYSPEDYAVYDIGTKKVPALRIVRGSFVQVMTPHFAVMEEQKRHRSIMALWHASASRLSLVYYPVIAALIAFAPEIIGVLLKAEYSGATPIFRIFALIMVGDALGGIEALLKAFAQNRFILWTTALQLGIALVGAWLGLKYLGLLGPAIAVVAASYVGQWIRIARIRSLMGIGVGDLLPWSQLGRTLALAVGSTLIGWSLGRLVSSPLLTLVVGLPVTGALYLGGALALDLLPASERDRLRRAWERISAWRRA